MSRLLWSLMLVIEFFFLTSITLGALFWRARKIQSRLRSELTALRDAVARGGDTQPAPAALPVTLPAEEPVQTDADVQQGLTTFEESDTRLNDVAERLREKNRTLQQQLEELQTRMTLSPVEREKLLELQY